MLQGVTMLQSGGDADDGLLEILIGETDGAQHRARAGAAGSIMHDRRVRAKGINGLGAHGKLARDHHTLLSPASAIPSAEQLS
jgi:hypothetical protein